MKKFLLNCFIFLAGFLGAIGWIIACASKVAGGVSEVLICVHGYDWIIIIALLIIALAGLLFAVKEVRDENKN